MRQTPRCSTALAEHMVDEGRAQEAIGEYRKALATTPGAPGLHHESSCDASYFTRCRVALCGSATSASSPTDSERNSFHSVPDCSSHPLGQQQTPHHPRFPFVRCGNVLFAAESCKRSNASPPRNCSSDPRLISAGAPHESTTPTSNLARASARTLVLCLALVKMQYGAAIQTL
jgi:ferredoxin